MNKFYPILIIISLMLIAPVLAEISTNVCDLDVSLINQDPYPATPDSYVDIVFQISGVQNSECDGATFELLPDYPFSLDENNGLKTLEGSTYTLDNKNEWMIPYKLRVDKDALDGNNSVKVRYNLGKWDSDTYYTENFDIIIQDSRTAFDAVIQETSGSDVSIAIANIGKYTANSVVVRIPEQEDFETSGVDGQMVGNLDSGDYTIVGFSLIQKMGIPNNSTRRDGMPPINFSQQSNSKLKFDIYYTDNIGERRVVNMDLPLRLGNSSIIGNFNGRKINSTGSLLSKWYFWVSAAVIILLLAGFYNKYKRRIRTAFQKTKDSSASTPDWIKKSKGR